MDIHFVCSCGQPIVVDQSAAGQVVNCPSCNQPLSVPESVEPEPTPTAETAPAASSEMTPPGDPQPTPASLVAPANSQGTTVSVAAQPTPTGFVVPSFPAGTTVIVQVQSAQPPPGQIGPANKSYVAVVLLWLIPIWGLPYFYLGQNGKALVLLLVDLLLLWPLIVSTCGLALFLVIPLYMVSLVDVLIVTSRIRTGAISTWRCF